jgi:hypothetical protein
MSGAAARPERNQNLSLKMNHACRTLALAFALLVSAWATAPHADAQASAFAPPAAPDGRIPITLVLTSGGGAPTVLRRAADESANVILLDSATMDAQQLSDAVFNLLIMEAQDPQGRRRSNHAAQRIRLDQPHPVYSWANEALTRLRSAPPRPVEALRAGQRYRIIQVWARPLRGMRR